MSLLVDHITSIMQTTGPFSGILIIILESIIPILPLGLFIALNIYVYGLIQGLFISWLGTLIGCLLSFLAVRKWFRNYFWHKITNKQKIINFMNYLSTINYHKLVLLIAIPFNPAFLINIGAGLSKISLKKFFLAILIGKLSIVYFWGYIGSSLIASLTNPSILIEIVIVLLITYLISKLVTQYLKIE